MEEGDREGGRKCKGEKIEVRRKSEMKGRYKDRDRVKGAWVGREILNGKGT